jgi:hypothetical protein
MSHFLKFVPITKIDAARREVYGVVTSEAPDKDGEICDYDTTKPHYEAWSTEFAQATAGKSLGNVREMHAHSAVGKVVDLVFDDPAKTIAVRARIVDDTAWAKCQEGVYTGFSHGGEYVGEPWPDGEFSRYTAKPSEVSLVDNPCNPEAHFEYVKADGSVELRKFAATPTTETRSHGAAAEENTAEGESESQVAPAPSPAGPAAGLDKTADAELLKAVQQIEELTKANHALREQLDQANTGMAAIKAQLETMLAEPRPRKTLAAMAQPVSKEEDNGTTGTAEVKQVDTKNGDPAVLKACLAQPIPGI